MHCKLPKKSLYHYFFQKNKNKKHPVSTEIPTNFDMNSIGILFVGDGFPMALWYFGSSLLCAYTCFAHTYMHTYVYIYVCLFYFSELWLIVHFVSCLKSASRAFEATYHLSKLSTTSRTRFEGPAFHRRD